MNNLPTLSTPLVSIVIPIFKIDKYIVQCIDSAISQTYKNIEILCIDDSGADNLPSELSSYLKSESRLKIIHHKENLGAGPARNTGISVSQGDYIYFLDADDWIEPKAIENLVVKACQDDSDIVIGSAFAFPDNKSENLKNISLSVNKWLKLSYVPGVVSGVMFYKAIGQIPCVVWGRLFRSTFLKSNKLTFIQKKIRYEDNGFHIKCMACEPSVSFCDDQSYKYRIRSHSVMNFGANNINIREKELHIRLSIEDAINYINTHKHTDDYVQMVRDAYWYCFANKIFLIRFYWGKYCKVLKVGKFSLLKQDYRNNKLRLRILGIPIWRWNLTDTKSD